MGFQVHSPGDEALGLQVVEQGAFDGSGDRGFGRVGLSPDILG